MIKDILLITILAIICAFSINAQSSGPEVIANSGETFKTNSLQIDWTLGELAITSIQSSNLKVSQGFHQGSYTISRLEDNLNENALISVFPNPTSERIEVNLQLTKVRKVQIQLFDVNGKLLLTKTNFGNNLYESLEVGSLPPGSYILHLLFDKEYFKTFKILKT